MELNIITGNLTSDLSKWWAETTNLTQNIGVEMSNSTEEECVIALVKAHFQKIKGNGQYIPETYEKLVVPLSEGTQS